MTKRDFHRTRKQWRRMLAGMLAASVLGMMALSGCGSESGKSDQDHVMTMEDVIEHAVEEGKEAAPEIVSVSEDRYVYQTLTEEQKAIYDAIIYAVENRLEDVELETLDSEQIDVAYDAVRWDYCNLFWMDQLNYVTYTLGEEVDSIHLTPKYTMTAEEQEQMQQQIDAEADRMLANVPVDGTDYDKALYVYETLIQEIEYVDEAPENQNIISAFVNHQTVCQGFAYATQYLLNRLEIPCTTVMGTADGEGHAWNLVIMDGAYYYIDTTWGDSRLTYTDEEETQGESQEEAYLDYDYFGATTEMLAGSHVPNGSFPLPECTSMEDNYFYHEGLYFDTWEPEQVGAIIGGAYDAGDPMVQIKFATNELCAQAMDYFIEEQHVVDYCEGLTTLHYMNMEDKSQFLLLFSTEDN